MTTKPRAYQQPHASITLREGLREYAESFPELIDPDDAAQAGTPAAAELFRCHDVVHVVFGTDTSFRQEVMTDTWTFFGTDVRLRTVVGYMREPAMKELLRELGWRRLIDESLRAIPAMLEVRRRSRRMTKKWPWHDHEPWLDVPLATIRREFGIEIVAEA